VSTGSRPARRTSGRLDGQVGLRKLKDVIGHGTYPARDHPSLAPRVAHASASTTAGSLTAMRQHPDGLWDAPAIWLRGGRGPVRGTVTSLRSELEFHHVDLAAGYAPDDWPAEFVAAELRRVTALMDRRADAPPVTLLAAAGVRIATVPLVDVTGPPAAILAWLSGRGNGAGLDTGAAGLPSLPPLA
jgi:maleylpyruvate isomerase